MNCVYVAIPPRMLTTATAQAAKSPALTFLELRNQIRQRRLNQGLSGNPARSLRLYPRLPRMLRCLVRLGSSFCLLIWDVDFFYNVVVRLSFVIATNVIRDYFHLSHPVPNVWCRSYQRYTSSSSKSTSYGTLTVANIGKVSRKRT